MNSTLTFLGTDSGFGLKNNSAYFENNNELVLIDCGFTVFQEVKEKFDLKKYDLIEIVITHLHNDHAGSLSQLILYLWFVLQKKAIVVSNCAHIKDYLDITGTPSEAYEFKDSLPNLTFIKTEHVKHLDTYGFKAIFNNKNIVYTSDTTTLSPFLPYLDNCNELYIDVSRFGGAHIKIDNIVGILKNLKQSGIDIYLMHIDDKEYIKSVTNDEFYCA